MEGIKASESAVHRQPWIVYSDRTDNVACVNPGGRLKSTDAFFKDPFLVIARKGDYLQLAKYKPENIKNNHLTQRKKAEYIGWMHRSRLILSPSSITDVQSGLHGKLLTAIGDTVAIMQPGAYWVPAVMLQDIGYQVFTGIPLADVSTLQKTLKYAPMIYPYHTDSTCSFVSGTLEPVIDKKNNHVFNINGKRNHALCLSDIPIRRRKFVVHPKDVSKKRIRIIRILTQLRWQCGLRKRMTLWKDKKRCPMLLQELSRNHSREFFFTKRFLPSRGLSDNRLYG